MICICTFMGQLLVVGFQSKDKEANHTVDSYLRKFTSEDNASFEELAALHNKKERLRNAWMYEAEEKHNKELVYKGKEMILAADEQLMLKAAPSAAEGWHSSFCLGTFIYYQLIS